MSTRKNADPTRVSCWAECCPQWVPDGEIFCVDHWLMVPLVLRKRIRSAPAATYEWLHAINIGLEVIALESGEPPQEHV